MKTNLKKLLLKSQLITLEEQECNELDDAYALEFAKDFKEELSLLNLSKKQKKEKAVGFKVPKKVLKKLHRKLALATHPDVSNSDASFVEVQEAYEKGDGSKLLSIASDMKIDIDLEEKEILALLKQLKEKRERINSLKSTIRWVWCTSDKPDDLRKKIRRLLGISDETWEARKGKTV